MAPITKCDVRMYTIGTGDCFVLSFRTARAKKPSFQMMIDCGAYNGTELVFEKHVNEILKQVNGEVDVLLITHEHQDHVLGFQRCKDLFVDELQVKELWMAWTEDESDEMVKKWKEEYGKKRRSLGFASERLKSIAEESSPNHALFDKIYRVGSDGEDALNMRKTFVEDLDLYTRLNVETDLLGAGEKKYVGGLKGMTVVKNDLKVDKRRYLFPGDVFEDIEGLDNIRIYVLGPPKNWQDVKTEHGKDGETYKHNKELEMVRGMSAFDLSDDYSNVDDVPFSKHYFFNPPKDDLISNYTSEKNSWRRIDFDWLFSAGELSLRLTRGINNLSVVLAIEFIESGKVMLFPGDAEFGSWKTWHEIKWNTKGTDDKHLTEDLLNRTVFYKVAHHMSHNGTAREKGLDLMIHPDLVAMGTVDYDVISKNWKNTMPNRGIVRDLLQKTKGKLIVMNTKDMFFDKKETVHLADAIEERRSQMSISQLEDFVENLDQENSDVFIEYTVDGS